MNELLPEWVALPAGRFLMGTLEADLSELARRFAGTRESYAEEAPQHLVALEAFRIARRPVSHGQYAAFVAATQARPPVQWHGPQPPQELADLPVVDVTWNEAQDYCTWLSQTSGVAVRLPTEAEWEYAARGDDGRWWPWGSAPDAARANVAEAALGGPCEAGRFPDGASPWGLLDMAGNVWEWTASLQAAYPYVASDGRESPTPVEGMDRRRIMRGGCWANPLHYARTTCRFRLPPERSTHLLGLRLASSD